MFNVQTGHVSRSPAHLTGKDWQKLLMTW